VSVDDLIDRLGGDLPPTGAHTPQRRLLLAALVGAAVALILVLTWLGRRPDLGQAIGTGFFWTKAAYTAGLGLAGFLAIDRLSRPAGSPRRGVALALLALGVLVLLGGGELLGAAPQERAAMWLGRSWRICPANILFLSLPMLALTLVAVRTLAPTRLAQVGAAAGLFSGGVAATVYGLHCPEATAAFVATWYSLGVVLTAALGAILGPFVLRWR
jgi:hypothetical protein